MRRAAGIALLAVFGCLALAAWLIFRSDVGVADSIANPTVSEYSHLNVTKGDVGWFRGSITVANSESSDRRAFVTVNLYDGDPNVGELTGDAVLKPNSESSIKLISIDDFVVYDEARVEVRYFGS